MMILALALAASLQDEEGPQFALVDAFFGPPMSSKLMGRIVSDFDALLRISPAGAPDLPLVLYKTAEGYFDLMRAFAAEAKEGPAENAKEAVARSEEARQKSLQLFRTLTDTPGYKEFRNLHQALFYLGYLLDRQKDGVAADACYERLRTEFPASRFNAPARISRAQRLFDSREFGDAVEAYGTCRDDASLRDYARYMQAWCEIRRKNPAEALKLFIEIGKTPEEKADPRLRLDVAHGALFALSMLPEPSAADAIALADQLAPKRFKPVLLRASKRYQKLGLTAVHAEIDAELERRAK